MTDGAGHALPGAAVNVYQTVYAWEGACAVKGVCASAPVLSDGAGLGYVGCERDGAGDADGGAGRGAGGEDCRGYGD